MFQKNNADTTEIDALISDAASHLVGLEVDTKEYRKALANYETLVRLRIDMTSTNKSQIKPSEWLVAGTNLAGILLVLNFEKTNALFSKAFGMVRRI